MAWRYECRDCDMHTTWMCRADAEDARYRHHDDAHSGRASRHERFVSDAERVDPRFYLWVFAVLCALWVLKTLSDLLH